MSGTSTEIRYAIAQRVSALILAPLVLIHIAVIVYASHGGLDAAEILGRTRGSVLWGTLYGLFVIAVAVHAATGVRVITREWFGLQGTALNWISIATGLLLLSLGLRAVVAVVLP